MTDSSFDFIVIGGGPAGSMTSLMLAQSGSSVCLVERKTFPRETLCGEFLSHEVVDMVGDLGLLSEFLGLGPKPITRFTLCPDHGRMISEPLGFTAYGLKRGTFDQFLLNAAIRQGVHLIQPAEAERIDRRGNGFEVRCRLRDSTRTIKSRWCVGAYGKKSSLDRQRHASFVGTRTHLNGVKIHVPSSALRGLNADEIRIFTGRNIYCGINQAGDGVATICFLERRKKNDVPPRSRLRELAIANKRFGDTLDNQSLSAIEAAPIYGSGDIYFGTRKVVQNGIFMVGDAARVISPIAGDGIGMALQSSQLLVRVFSEHIKKGSDSSRIEEEYWNRWNRMFTSRLRVAAMFQRILLSTPLRVIGTTLLLCAPSLLGAAIAATRSDRH